MVMLSSRAPAIRRNLDHRTSSKILMVSSTQTQNQTSRSRLGQLTEHISRPYAAMAAGEMPEMQYRNLGSSGLKVSKVIVGTMSYGSPDWQGWVLNEEQ